MKAIVSRLLGSVLGAAVASGDGPWRAKTVWIAMCVTLLGAGLWARDAAMTGTPAPGLAHVSTETAATSIAQWDFSRPIPGYVAVSASYVGGFFIGWLFRRFVRLAVTVTALVVMGVGLGKYIGWDSTKAAESVRTGAAWVEREATEATDYLTGLLPSTGAAGVGGLLGFRRRGRIRDESG